MTAVNAHVRAWPLAAGATVSAAALTLLFAHTLAAYWSFYHLGAPGTGFFLAIIVLPVGFVLSLNIIFFSARALRRRGAGLGRAIAGGVLAAGILFVMLLASEIWRTTALRSGEGEGAGNLAPYVLYHLEAH